MADGLDRAAAVRDEYGRLARVYDRRWSFYVEATLRETLNRIALLPDEAVLDVGCGTGALLEGILKAAPGARVWGTDPTPEMLAVARERLDDSVALVQSGAQGLPFPDGAFSLVVSTSAFHYFLSPLEALREMHRVLRPGGRVVITDWCDDFFSCRVCDRFLRVFNRAHLGMYGEEQCARWLDEAGFDRVGVDRYKINWLWGLMTAVGERR